MNLLTLLVLGAIGLICNCENFKEICYDIKQFHNLNNLYSLYSTATSRSDKQIQKNGYPVENHSVTTEDGYILSMQRIPHGLSTESKQDAAPILILHGLFTSSTPYTYFTNSLPYALVNEGYDVWLGNFRTSFRDTRHIKYSQSDSKYWNFGVEEMAELDTPAMIEYILQTTNHTQVSIVAMSLSTLSTTYMLAFNPKLNKKVSRLVELAPVAHFDYISNPIPNHKLLILFGMSGIKDDILFSLTKLAYYFAPVACSFATSTTPLCQGLLTLMVGYSPGTYGFCIGGIFGSLFRGVSVKTILHLHQMFMTKQLMRYDYDLIENLARYGTKEPPIADVSQITVPTCLIYSANDPLGNPLNVAILARQMKGANVVLLEDTMANHLDFVVSALDDNMMKYINQESRKKLKNQNKKIISKILSRKK